MFLTKKKKTIHKHSPIHTAPTNNKYKINMQNALPTTDYNAISIKIYFNLHIEKIVAHLCR